MDVRKQFVAKGKMKAQLDDLLTSEIRRAGYVSVDMQRTPLGHRLTIVVERPGIVIGRHGTNIRDMTATLEKRFSLENVQIAIVPVASPELNAKVMAVRIASALERGVHFRRAAYIALRQIMEAGARGAEIVISGKLTTERSRFEKFRNGVLLKSGEPYEQLVDEASTSVLLKPGLTGVRVRILPPVQTPDDIKVRLPEETAPTQPQPQLPSQSSATPAVIPGEK